MSAGASEREPGWTNARVLWSFLRPRRLALVAGIVLGLMITGATLAMPLVLRNLLDGLSTRAGIGDWVALLVALLLVGAALSLVQEILLGRLSEDVVLDARVSMVDRLLSVHMRELVHRPTGELVTRATSDTVLLRDAVRSIVEVVNSVVGVVGAVMLMALLDWVLLLTTICALLVVATALGALMPRIARVQELAQGAVGRMSWTLEGTLRAIRTIKAERAEPAAPERITAEAEIFRAHSVRAIRLGATAWVIAGGAIQLAVLSILGLGGTAGRLGCADRAHPRGVYAVLLSAH